MLDQRSFSVFANCLKYPESRAASRVIDHIGVAIEEISSRGFAEVGTLERAVQIPVCSDMAGQHRHAGINVGDAGLEPGPSRARRPARPRRR